MDTSRLLLAVVVAGASVGTFLAGSACTINSTTTPDDAGLGTIDLGDSGTPIDTDTGSPATVTVNPLTFVPSNMSSFWTGVDFSQLVDIDVTAADNEASSSCGSQASSSATGGGCIVKTVTQSDGSTLQLYIARSWKIEPTATLRITDHTPVALVALTTFDVLGKIEASAVDNVPVSGGAAPTTSATKGGGTGGGSPASDATSTYFGGGGGGNCGAGGKGGLATGSVGLGGVSYGNAALTPLAGGSAGGSGTTLAGAGGGAVQLVAGTTLNVASGGVVHAGGGGGGNGGAYSAGQAAAGGGSGGAILLEAPSVTIAGAVSANGGGGGGGGDTAASGDDSTGDAIAAPGGNVGTLAAGGNGSATSTTVGADGQAGDSTHVPGGGGGGAGWVRVNSTSGTASLTGVVSPSVGACASQGILSSSH